RMDQGHPSFFVCNQPVFRGHTVGKMGGYKCENITFRLNKRKKSLIIQPGKTDKFPELMALVGHLPIQFKKSRHIRIAKHTGNLRAVCKTKDEKTIDNIQFLRTPMHGGPVDVLVGVPGDLTTDRPDHLPALLRIRLYVPVLTEKFRF